MKENKNKNSIMIVAGIAAVIIIAIILVLILNKDEQRYSVTFEVNGGSLVEAVIVNENGKVTVPESPEKEGYKFDGWYLNGEPYDFSTKVTSDIKLEAKWTKIEESKPQEPEKEDTKPDDDKKEDEDKEDKDETIKVTKVSLNKTKLTLSEGESSKLTATVKPSDATNKDVTWKSSNKNVAKVDSKGNVTAIKAGTATITVTTKDGSYKATCKVTVKAKQQEEQKPDPKPEDPKPEPVVSVTGVTLSKTTLSLTEGDSSKLTATVKPSDAANKEITWSSSNTSVATVDTNGNVKAIKAGTATITVTTKDGNYTATCKVTVTAKQVEPDPIVSVTGVTLNKSSLNLTEGDSSKLTATVKPSDAANKEVTWKSSNTSVATVDTNGNVKAIKAGTATITVTTKDGNHTATCTVTVKEKPASYVVTITPEAQDVGSTLRYKVSVTKNGSAFTGYDRLACGRYPKLGSTISLSQYEAIKNEASATLIINGTDVQAKVIFKK